MGRRWIRMGEGRGVDVLGGLDEVSGGGAKRVILAGWGYVEHSIGSRRCWLVVSSPSSSSLLPSPPRPPHPPLLHSASCSHGLDGASRRSFCAATSIHGRCLSSCRKELSAGTEELYLSILCLSARYAPERDLCMTCHTSYTSRTSSLPLTVTTTLSHPTIRLEPPPPDPPPPAPSLHPNPPRAFPVRTIFRDQNSDWPVHHILPAIKEPHMLSIPPHRCHCPKLAHPSREWNAGL